MVSMNKDKGNERFLTVVTFLSVIITLLATINIVHFGQQKICNVSASSLIVNETGYHYSDDMKVECHWVDVNAP